MPKQQLVLRDFKGGLNTDSDPRDININEFSVLEGFSLHDLGIIKTIGAAANSDITGLSGVIDSTHGHFRGLGLFPFSSDYNPSGNPLETDYLLLQDGDLCHVFGKNKNTSQWETSKVDLNTDGTHFVENVEPNYYAPGGGVRICDGYYTNTRNHPKIWDCFGETVLAEKDGGGTTNDYAGNVSVGNSWYVGDAGVEANPFITAGATSTNTAGPDANLVMHNSIIDGDGVSGMSADMDSREMYWFATSNERYSQATWGLGLSYSEKLSGTAGSYAGATSVGTWQPDENTKYKFYATVVRQGDQESHPKEFLMFGSQEDSTKDGLGSGDSEIQFLSGFADTHAGGTVGSDMAVYFMPHLRINGSTSGTPGTPYFAFGNSSLTADGTTSGQEGDERITGCRIYYAENTDGYSNLWKLFDLDFKKGCRPYGMGGTGAQASHYHPWTRNTADSVRHFHLIPDDFTEGGVSTNVWYDPPKIETYEDYNGYPHDTKLNAKWQTAVVANGRTYIGSIKRQSDSTFNGGGTWNTSRQFDPEFGDRIVKSPVGKHDTFPDIYPNTFFAFDEDDGDRIIKLETFADRLLIFKKRTLHILNISRDVEVPEATYKNHGLDLEKISHSVRTDYGIAWFNTRGVYFYDGRQVESLTDNKIKSTWTAGSGYPDANSTIGFDPNSSKILISRSTDATSDILLYDLKNKSWTSADNALSSNNRTNMVIFRGYTTWIEDIDTTLDDGESNLPVEIWKDEPQGTVNVNLRTMDIDFGTPAVRKKIYKVYISYKGDGQNVEIRYAVDGDTDTPTTTFYRTESDGASDGTNSDTTPLLNVGTDNWVRAELKPTASINNIYSFQLYMTGTSVASDFEINDITIVYRAKALK